MRIEIMERGFMDNRFLKKAPHIFRNTENHVLRFVFFPDFALFNTESVDFFPTFIFLYFSYCVLKYFWFSDRRHRVDMICVGMCVISINFHLYSVGCYLFSFRLAIILCYVILNNKRIVLILFFMWKEQKKNAIKWILTVVNVPFDSLLRLLFLFHLEWKKGQ